MTTSKDLANKASAIANIYADLQDEILKQIIKRFNTKDLANMSQDDVLKWQIRKLNELGNANGDTIQAILKAVKMSTTGITDLLNMISDTAVQNADTGLKTATGLPTQPTNHVDMVMKAYQKQTLGDINNHINQSLISKNFKDTAQAQAYTDIINKTVAKVVTGLKSPQQALADTVYQWQNQGGLKSGFVDKGGHHWKLQGYANTVIQSTVPRTYGAITKQRMDDYDYHLVLYPAHPTAREACAPMQGHVVNMVPTSDPNFDPHYDTVYNHGYGTAGGGHGSSFACHIVNGEPEIWTAIKDISNGKNYIGKFAWKANSIVKLGSGVTNLCATSGFRRLSVDFVNGYALTTSTSGAVEVSKLSDVESGKWNPCYTAKVQEFGMHPTDTSVDNDTNTMQSNDISFPYVFVNSGASTNADKRLLICFNIVTHSLVFSMNPDADQFGGRIFNPDDNSKYDFEPEAIGIYMNDGKPFIMQGFNYELPDNSESYEARLHIGLWTTAIEFRDDSKDIKSYPEDDDAITTEIGGD